MQCITTSCKLVLRGRVVMTSVVNSRTDLRSILSCKCIWGLERAAATGVDTGVSRVCSPALG
jgi:hypothetical protein